MPATIAPDRSPDRRDESSPGGRRMVGPAQPPVQGRWLRSPRPPPPLEKPVPEFEPENESDANPSFDDVVTTRFGRRSLLKGALTTGGIAAVAPTLLLATSCEGIYPYDDDEISTSAAKPAATTRSSALEGSTSSKLSSSSS